MHVPEELPRHYSLTSPWDFGDPACRYQPTKGREKMDYRKLGTAVAVLVLIGLVIGLVLWLLGLTPMVFLIAPVTLLVMTALGTVGVLALLAAVIRD